MVKRWFVPYEVLHVYPNATYKLCELDGTNITVPIAGKRVKLFKKRDGQILYEDIDKQQDDDEPNFDMDQDCTDIDEDQGVDALSW
ncbi:hypothetical protein, partial [Escherichia coli]|uniref:hypothetical protein n=1 Tax=Escherichia coli TaxID=562 RepID=UPI001AD8B1AE